MHNSTVDICIIVKHNLVNCCYASLKKHRQTCKTIIKPSIFHYTIQVKFLPNAMFCFTYIMPLVVTSSEQKYIMVMAQRTSQSKVNSMLNRVVEGAGVFGAGGAAGASWGSLRAEESSGARTNLRLSLRIFMSAFRVLLGSLAVGAGYGN